MKKYFLISLLCISALFGSAQITTPLKINKYLVDSLASDGFYRLFKDTTRLGDWGLISGGSGGGSGSGTVNSGTINRLTYYAATGTAVSSLSAITGSRALISNASGLPTHSAVTDLQLSYLGNATSDIQNQINLKAPIASPTFTGTVVIPNGSNLGTPTTLVGTNITGTASGLTAGTVTTNANLTGDVTSVGNATSIASGVIVNADINASAAIDATKLIDGSVSNTELGYINTLTSNAQTQLDGKLNLPTVTVSSATTLALTNTGSYIKTYVFSGASDAVWTLPAIGTTGQKITVVSRGTGDLTVQRAGSDQIFTSTTTTSFILYTGDSQDLQDDGTYWKTL